MRQFVSFNHQILPASESHLSAFSVAALYGKGIFTTLAVYQAQPFLWEKHWRRLSENAERMGIELAGFSEESVKHSLAAIIKQNAITEGRARLTFFDEKPSRIWSFESQKGTSLLITAAEFREPLEVKLTVSPFSLNSASPLANVKSCNYLENILALQEANRRGFNEALRLNEKGHLASACLANIFWLKDEEIYTPSLKTGCLAGTTREFLVDNFAVSEVEAPPEALTGAETIFLTSAGIGMLKVESFEAQKFRHPPSFSRLKTEFLKLSESNSGTQ